MREEPTREEAEASAIEEGPEKIGDLTFRTFTSLSFDRCMRFEIRLAVAGQEEIESMTGFEVMREAAFVGWMQTSPRSEVRSAFAEGEDSVWDAVDEWEEKFNDQPNPPWALLIEIVAKIVITGKLLAIDLIETAAARELNKDAESPPPNSSSQDG